MNNKKIILMGCQYYPYGKNNSRGIFFKNHTKALEVSPLISKIFILCISTSIKDFLGKGIFLVNRDSKKIISFHITLPLGRLINPTNISYFLSKFSYLFLIRSKIFKIGDEKELILISQSL